MVNDANPTRRSSRPRVIVGVSGGVDSAVAALTLVEAGYDVEALFMFNWREDETGRCQAAADFDDAHRVCDTLGIALHRADFSREYKARVFQYFLDSYAAGRTPNPDVLCNREIKFSAFLDYAERLGGDYIATGHYARTAGAGPATALLRGIDADKDQSYFLAAVPQAALARTLFPLGDRLKKDVRERARNAGLAVHAKPDSTGVCFIGERDFAGFLRGYVDVESGPIRVSGSALDGQTIGAHRGLACYTVGQRRGLGLGGIAGASDAPWFVVDKSPATGTLWVTQDVNHPRLTATVLQASAPHWLTPPPASPFSCAAQVRYRQRAIDCTVAPAQHGVTVCFAEPPHAIMPGQYVVFYDGERCLGCAEIERVDKDSAPARSVA